MAVKTFTHVFRETEFPNDSGPLLARRCHRLFEGVGAAKKLGVAHTAQWGDIWYPLVESLRDPAVAVERLRLACKEAGRADKVSITFSALKSPSYDDLMRYRELGVSGMVFKPFADESDHAGLLRPLDRYAELNRRISPA